MELIQLLNTMLKENGIQVVLAFFPIIISIFTLTLLKNSIDSRTKYQGKIDKELDTLSDLLSKLQFILEEFKHDTINMYEEINRSIRDLKQCLEQKIGRE